MNESPTARVERLLPRIQRLARRYANSIDADDLTQESLIVLLGMEDGQTDAYYVQRARWTMLGIIRNSARYADIPTDDASLEEGTPETPAAPATSGPLAASELSEDARKLAVLRWAGFTWLECRAEIGVYRYPFARRELDRWAERVEVEA